MVAAHDCATREGRTTQAGAGSGQRARLDILGIALHQLQHKLPKFDTSALDLAALVRSERQADVPLKVAAGRFESEQLGGCVRVDQLVILIRLRSREVVHVAAAAHGEGDAAGINWLSEPVEHFEQSAARLRRRRPWGEIITAVTDNDRRRTAS